MPLAVWAAGLARHGLAVGACDAARGDRAAEPGDARCGLQCSRFSVPAIGRARHRPRSKSADPRRPCFRSANVRRPRCAASWAGAPPTSTSAPTSSRCRRTASVAAPYHRLEKGILANHAIMDGTPGTGAAHHRGAGRELRGPMRGTARQAPNPTGDHHAARPAARRRPPRFPARAGFAGQYRNQSPEGRTSALNRSNADATNPSIGGIPRITVDPELRLASDEGLARLHVIRAHVA